MVLKQGFPIAIRLSPVFLLSLAAAAAAAAAPRWRKEASTWPGGTKLQNSIKRKELISQSLTWRKPRKDLWWRECFTLPVIDLHRHNSRALRAILHFSQLLSPTHGML